jgi:hypothetical protein
VHRAARAGRPPIAGRILELVSLPEIAAAVTGQPAGSPALNGAAAHAATWGSRRDDALATMPPDAHPLMQPAAESLPDRRARRAARAQLRRSHERWAAAAR